MTVCFVVRGLFCTLCRIQTPEIRADRESVVPTLRESIMHIPIDNDWRIGDFEVEQATELSQGDKDWASKLYPKSE